MLSLTRIGPSVFHAILSTLLALIALGTSNSFVFQSFFKSLLLVTLIAGAHGLWLLPVALAMVGGDMPEEIDVDAQQPHRAWPATQAKVIGHSGGDEKM